MKKNLSDSLKASIDQERKAVKSKNFNTENRFARAEAIFDNEKNVIQEKPKSSKEADIKVVRDTFTLPESDYRLIEDCKLRSLSAKYVVNKSEIIRAGLIVLSALKDKEFTVAIKAVKKIKTGRPKL